MTNRGRKGSSLLELVMVLAIGLIIIAAALMTIQHTGQVQRTEYARNRVISESRFILNTFAQEVKDAGGILTMTNTSSFLSQIPMFNGIYPLNRTNAPDGIILASGDPDAVTNLRTAFTPSSSATINAKKLTLKSGIPPWAANDVGIVISNEGYYVFSVASVDTGNNVLTIRGTPVYRSMLLNSEGYADSNTLNSYIKNGQTITYPINAPIIRLTDFSIYMFKSIYNNMIKRNIYQMVRINDTKGIADALNNDLVTKSIVSENIFDMQISYTAWPLFPVENPKYVFLEATPPSLSDPFTADNVYSMLAKKYVKQVNVTFLMLTDEYGTGGKRSLSVNAVNDRPTYSLPAGNYNFQIITFNVQPKNFNIVI